MLSLIIPTFNERDNIQPLLEKLSSVLGRDLYEIIVVDDNSPDQTAQKVREFAKQNPRIRLLVRTDRYGLSSAVIDGFKISQGNILGAMDADHSHDVSILPMMVKLIEDGKADCAVGSRRIPGGGEKDWPWDRRLYSELATFAARMLAGVSIKDPMSGYFCVSRTVFERTRNELKPRGYKILLEILAKAGKISVAELPYVFTDRQYGKSKLSAGVATAFGLQLAELWYYRFESALSRRFPFKS